MICPHCSVAIHADWAEGRINLPHPARRDWRYESAVCPDCDNAIIVLVELRWLDDEQRLIQGPRFLVYPHSPASPRIDIDAAVPDPFTSDYTEARNVLEISSKASAALARRVLQGILTDQGYRSNNLAQQIDAVLDENDPMKVLPSHIRETIDAVRHFGNFAAHPITEVTSLQIVDVEPEEAEWCLEIIEALFDHYYVTPARARERRDQLNQKLAQAGKKPAKS